MVGHGVSPENRLVVLHFQAPHVELVPLRAELVGLTAHTRVSGNIDVFEIDIDDRHVDLDVSARFEIEVFPFRQAHDEFLDKGRHVVVRHHFALPFFDAEDLFRHADLHVLANFDLAGQSLVFGHFAARQMVQLGGQHVAAAIVDMAFAHGAGSAAAAGGGQENVLIAEGRQ